MEKGKKRVPIRIKIQRVVMFLCLAALLVAVIAGSSSLWILRGSVMDADVSLGESAANTSTKMILQQMNQSATDVATAKGKLADARLNKYADYVRECADYIHNLYLNPDAMNPITVLPPDKKNAGTLTLMRDLRDPSVSAASVSDEMSLLGNAVHIFSPIISTHEDTVATVYLATESGFMISYDKYSDTADTSDGETYFDFSKRPWYQNAKGQDSVIFTDTYLDDYSRGLTVTCAAPFYDASGNFAGVVSMDILISSMNQNIISVDMGDGINAFLLNRTGEIIASPDMTTDTTELEKITDETSSMYSISGQLMSGSSGFIEGSDDAYYAYMPISSASWTFVLRIPSSRITAPSEQIRTDITNSTTDTAKKMAELIGFTSIIFLVILACVIGAVILLVSKFSRSLTSPITALDSDVQEISSGNLEHQARIYSNDEIGDLAKSFNSMTMSLKDYIKNLTAVTAEKERIGAELDVAKSIQASMLPCIFPAFPERPDIDLYATMTPAKEVGGDFYDYYYTDPGHVAITIADVSGKGVPAALFMVIAKTLLKNAAQSGLTPKEVMEKVNAQLWETNKEGMFVTVWLGILELETGTMTYVNAGHEYPVVMHKGGEYSLVVEKHGIILAGMPKAKYTENILQLQRGDRIFLFTDGVSEATDAHQVLYGTGRMLDALNRHNHEDCEKILVSMKADIDAFVGEAPQFDDITMVSIMWK